MAKYKVRNIVYSYFSTIGSFVWKTVFIMVMIHSIGQSQNIIYESYSIKEGLPSSEFYDLIQDSSGLMWFTSDKGIVSYDSYEFKTYTLEDGLSNMVNFNFYKENRNTFWVNAMDGTFTQWSGNHFVPFKFNDNLIEFKSAEYQWHEIVNIDNDYIYFIRNYDVTEKIRTYKINRHSGQISKHGGKKIVPSANCSPKTIRAVNQINYSNENDVKYTSPINKTTFLGDRNQEIKNENFNLIHCEYISDQKEHYFLTDRGIEIYDEGNFSKSKKSYSLNAAASAALILSSGELWVTTLSSGLIKIVNQDLLKFKLPNSYSDNIEKLFPMKNQLFAKNISGDIFLIDPELNIENQINGQGKRGHSIAHRDVLDTTIYQFVGFEINKHKQIKNHSKSFTFIHLNNQYTLGIGFSGASLFCHNQDQRVDKVSTKILSYKHKGDLHYFGTLDGLYMFDAKTLMHTQPHFTKNINLNGKRINDIIVQTNGTWLGILGEGLFLCTDKECKEPVKVKGSPKSILSLASEGDSVIWIGTNRGINKCHYSINNGVLDVKEWKHFNLSHGLSSNYIKTLTYWNDYLWIGTDSGLMYVRPDLLDLNIDPPQININFIKSGNQEKIEHFDQLVFANKDNDIQIGFSGITKYKPEKGQEIYRYSLMDEGSTKFNWKSTNNRALEFLNMDPGRYQFNIQCQNSNHVWSDTKRIDFTIEPHFTQTLIFKAFVPILLIFVLSIIWHFKSKAFKNKVNLELRLKKAELAILRNQMNPHFIFNSLNSIQNYIFSNKKTEANLFLHTLSNLVRKSLSFSRVEYISLEDEIEFIQEYLLLEKMRFNDKFNFTIEYDDSILLNKIMIPALITQPIIENSVKHAFKKKKEVGKIDINYQLFDHKILITIKDDGMGFNSSKISKNGKYVSLGLNIIRQRIHLINEKLKLKTAQLEISSNFPFGTICSITLPIERL